MPMCWICEERDFQPVAPMAWGYGHDRIGEHLAQLVEERQEIPRPYGGGTEEDGAGKGCRGQL